MAPSDKKQHSIQFHSIPINPNQNTLITSIHSHPKTIHVRSKILISSTPEIIPREIIRLSPDIQKLHSTVRPLRPVDERGGGSQSVGGECVDEGNVVSLKKKYHRISLACVHGE